MDTAHDLPRHLIPYVVAVTGHRDIVPEDIPGLKSCVRDIVDRLVKRMPSTPVLLLSALAEGADQIVADAALDAGARLAAVLPMPVDIYRETIGPKTAPDFDRLLSRASLVIHLDQKATPDDLRTSEDARRLQYEELARYLASHCQALIALWDGTDSNMRGGTYQVVRSVLVGTDHKNLIEPLRGTVFHVVTRRLRNPGQVADNMKVHVLRCQSTFEEHGIPWQRMAEPFPAAAADFAALESTATAEEMAGWRLALAGWRALVAGRVGSPAAPVATWRTALGRNWIERTPSEAPVDNFNRLSAALGETGKSPYRLQPASWAGAPWPYLARIEECWQRADVLAMNYQKRRSRFLVAMLSAIALAAIGLETHSNLMAHANLLWLAFPLAICLAWLIHRASRALNVENWFLDSRALAEGMRVQYFWELGGVHRDVWEHYLAHRSSELGWIIPAMRGLAIFRHENPQPGIPSATDIEAAIEGWVDDQKKYYGRKSHAQHRTLEKFENLSNRILAGVVGVSLLTSLVVLTDWPQLECLRHMLHAAHKWIHWIILVVTGLAGVLKLWAEQNGYDEQCRNYRRMGHLFEHRAKALRRHLAAGDRDQAIEGLKELGLKALEENSIWLIMHRAHPLRVSHGG